MAFAFLGLLLNVGTVLNGIIGKLESEKTLIVQLNSIMETLRKSILTKLQQGFYGSMARNLLLKCDDQDKIVQFKRQADGFLERILSYLEKW